MLGKLISLGLVNLVIWVLVEVQGTGVGHAARVLELSDRFLEVRKNGVWLVKFYAPWCGHCKKLEPIFNHVAQALHDTNVRVAKVDCTRFPSVATEFNVKGYPTIMFISGSRLNTYNGERLAQDIVEYAKRMNGPPVTEITAHPLDIEGPLFGYYGPKNEPLWQEFDMIAKENQDTDRYFHFTTPVAVSSVPIVINKKSNGLILNMTESARLRDFVAAHRFDLFIRLTRTNFHRFIQTKKWVVIGVIAEDKLGRSTSHQLQFRDLLESMQETVDWHRYQLAWTTAVDFMSKFVTSELQTPYILVINSSNYEHYFLHEEDEGWSRERIMSYLDEVSQGGGTAYGGDTYFVRLNRAFYELRSSLADMWNGNPILTIVLFGLPMGFFSLIIYSIFCADFMDEAEEDVPDEDEFKHHEKHD